MSEDAVFPLSPGAAALVVAARLKLERPPHRNTMRGWAIRFLSPPTECIRYPGRVLILRPGLEKILNMMHTMEPTR